MQDLLEFVEGCEDGGQVFDVGFFVGGEAGCCMLGSDCHHP